MLGLNFFITLGLNFNWARTNSAMTHAMVLSAKVRRNEQLWHTLDIGGMCGPTFGFKNSKYFQIKE